MHDRDIQRARLLSSAAATVISLACGTNYVYSAWAPQFADKLHLSATESNLIGLAGNLGMYLFGIPTGMFVDAKGPRPAVVVGSILLLVGYYPLHTAYEAGSGSVPFLCLCSLLTGLGGCGAFAAAVKTSALNWPHHRGTATAFPLAAFGLSAFFFSLVGSISFPGDPSRFLALLAFGTFAMTLSGFFFLRVLPPPSTTYHAVPEQDDLADSQVLHRTASQEAKLHRGTHDLEPGTSSASQNNTATTTVVTATYGAVAQHISTAKDEEQAIAAETSSRPQHSTGRAPPGDHAEVDETSSLMSSNSSTSTMPGDVLVQDSVDLELSHRLDIRGLKLLKTTEFWQLFSIMGLLAGIGLMTINNIGNDATALWKHYDNSIDDKKLALHQQLHVSILSIGSFCGRLLSGVGSDFLVKSLHASRIWCLVVASGIFTVAQICALNIENPELLGFVSGFTGLGYGFLFGVFPSIVAESFGIHGLSQNWGAMTLSPVLSSNVFNIFYGSVYDAHSIVEADGSRGCEDGIYCYYNAYQATILACGVGSALTLWVIWHQKKVKALADNKVIGRD
ncbi:major facilitator superfamily domain-containing protein [Microdochium bolleyi]|uniref:Major facilitator superfamily domain-containing protein n=1 Tax=Microdochium bolleyi TaxID=196109 RepID=A0A136J569_9PEZI|nr:major facilitator superfamily domain-containing protein [Microdochium bolleyi]